MAKPDGGPAFPVPCDYEASGMSLRDYFAIRAPEPSEAAVNMLAEADRLANPHGDSYKPPRRTRTEIISFLRYAYADAMLAEREKE